MPNRKRKEKQPKKHPPKSVNKNANKTAKTPPVTKPPVAKKKQGGFSNGIKAKLFGRADAPHTAQQSIPYKEMYRDGLCRVNERLYTKTIVYLDINYQLAQNDVKTAIFEGWCDFLNFFDSTISVQFSFINQQANKKDVEKSIVIQDRNDIHDDTRREFSEVLKTQLAKGNNGLKKVKYVTFGIEAETIKDAKMRLERIEADILANFKALGVKAFALNGLERLEVMHGVLHPDGKEKLNMKWEDLAKTGMSTKDYISPTSFTFNDGKTFKIGNDIGAVSFLQLNCAELSDRVLADFLDMENAAVVSIHIQSIDQAKAIKTVKRKLTDLDKMKIEEQKKAVRAGYDMDIIPSDLATYGKEAQALLQDLQSRNERMFLTTILVMNTAKNRKELENNIFTAAGIAQKHNCVLKRLDYQQEQGLMSSLPIGLNQIDIQRGLTTSSTAIFVPFTTEELFQSGEAFYYGLNAISNNIIMVNRKNLKNPKGVYCKGTGTPRNLQQARKPFAAQVDGQPQERNGNGTSGDSFQNLFEKGSDLPPVFLLLVRGNIQILGLSDYALKTKERRLTSVFYTTAIKKSISKGAKTMQTALTGKDNTRRGTGAADFKKRIGSTTYVVSVHFSKTSKETIEDKIMRMIESEARKTA